MRFSSNHSQINKSNHIYMVFLMLVLVFIFSCSKENTETTNMEQIETSFPFKNRMGFLEEKINFSETIYDENNVAINLENLKGNVVLIAFSTSWCPNCPSVLASLDRLSEILKNRKIENVKIIALNVGSEHIDAVKKHFEDLKIKNLKIFNSISPSIMEKLNIQGVPTCLLFGINGEYMGGYVGGDANFSSDDFVNYIEKISAN